jgi:Uma2 family endonuclease
LNIGPEDNLANDITIRRTKDSIIDRNATGYAKKPPVVVLEVDIKVDTANGSDFDYVLTKTEKLLAFGVEQVVWILTASRKIVVATQQNPSLTPYEWKQPVLLIDNCGMNLEEWVKKACSRYRNPLNHGFL